MHERFHRFLKRRTSYILPVQYLRLSEDTKGFEPLDLFIDFVVKLTASEIPLDLESSS